MRDPILVPCEGGGCSVHLRRKDHGVCPMCGEWVLCTPSGFAVGHTRQDILAQIDRGDYG